MRLYSPARLVVDATSCPGGGHPGARDPVQSITGAGRLFGRCRHCRELHRIVFKGGAAGPIVQHFEPYRLILHPADGDRSATLDPVHPTGLDPLGVGLVAAIAWHDPEADRIRATWHGGPRHRSTTHALAPRLLDQARPHLTFTQQHTRDGDVVELVLAGAAWELPQWTP